MHGDVCLAAKVGVGARVWLSPLSPRTRSPQERRQRVGGRSWSGGAACRRRLGRGRRAQGYAGSTGTRVCHRPSEAPVGLRAGVCGGREPAGRVCAPNAGSDSISSHRRLAWLPIWPLQPACLPICPPTCWPSQVPARPPAPGSRAWGPGALGFSLSATPGHGFGQRLWPWSSLWAATLGRIRALPNPTFILDVCRAGLGGHR